ncbi:MAG: DUF4129 domain-containing protein [Acidimicrobiia bacterium]
MTARTAYALAAVLVLGVSAAAFVSRNESRNDFIIRQQVGNFEVDAPELNPPDLNGPDIDGPDFQGPNINGPSLSWLDVAYTLLLVLSVIALIIGVILVIRRFGPGRADDGVDTRTIRLAGLGHSDSHVAGEEGWAAFERFCYALLQDPEPSRAVRVAMRYAEAGLGRLDSRIADETPNEWLRKVREVQPDLSVDLAPIISSYQSVRFGDNGVSPAERDAAVNSLRRLARNACGAIPPASPDPASATPGGPT